jgi:hypothetical protein
VLARLTAPLPAASQTDSTSASVADRATASQDAGGSDSGTAIDMAVRSADLFASENAGAQADHPAGGIAVVSAGGIAGPKVGGNAGRRAAGKARKKRRRVGRPRGPVRVPLTVRVLATTDARLTAAVEMTGDSPQYIVEAALAAWLDALGIPR